MERCPVCRAALNGATTCRRCRAELASVQRVAREADRLAGAAIARLARDDPATATRLLRRALALRATSDLRALARLVAAQAERSRQPCSR